MRRIAFAAASLLLIFGAVVALKPFNGAVHREGTTVRVRCGAPLRAVNARDTRRQIAALRRLAPRTGDAEPTPPLARDVARFNRLVASADRYEACRARAARTMAVADVLVFLGLVAMLGSVWLRRAGQPVRAPARG